MSAAANRPGRSPWRHTRYWTTLACLSALGAGMLTLAAGHPLHGWLLVLASLVLVKGTIWGRRSRRRPDMPMLAQTPETTSAQQNRKWRKAA